MMQTRDYVADAWAQVSWPRFTSADPRKIKRERRKVVEFLKRVNRSTDAIGPYIVLRMNLARMRPKKLAQEARMNRK